MEVTLDGATYRTGRLDAFAQLHVARRLFPVLPGFLGTLIGSDPEKQTPGDLLLMAAGPVGQALSMMPQEDVDFIARTCLNVAQKKDGDAWAAMAVDGKPMFSDMSLAVLVGICVHTIRENLGNFLPGKATQT